MFADHCSGETTYAEDRSFDPKWLDRLADIELQHGHHGAAEQLAERAAQLREAAR